MPFNYSGHQVLIIGGTSGIGWSIAKAFATAGAYVTATGATTDEVSAAETVETAVSFRPLDVRDGTAIARLVGEFKSLEVLVNCAGVLCRNGAEFDSNTFDDVIDINLSGTMRACVAARPLLAKSKGGIVNIASMLSFFGSGFVPAYSASKGGIAQLTKSLAIAWAADGIRVNAVAPGWIDTPMTKALIDNPDRNRQIIERTPLGRWGQPDDVAGPVLFLCSPAARFVTGAILPVDGGYSAA